MSDIITKDWFDDLGIIRQTACDIVTRKGVKTVGISMLTDGSEIVLELGQLKALVDFLEDGQ